MIRNVLDSVRVVPGNAQAWHALGLAALEADRLDEAHYALVHAVTLAPAEVERALLAADCLAERQVWSAAEEILRLLVQGQPERSDLRVRLSRLLIASGDERAALAEVDRALDEDPGSAELRLQAAQAHAQLGELDEAAQHLTAVLAGDPGHREANRQLGMLLCRTGKGQRGAAHLERAFSGGRPPDPEAATLLAIECSRQERHAEAIALLQGVVASQPDGQPAPEGAATLANLGMALLAAGQVAEGLDAFQGAFDLDPHSAQATCGLGLAYQKLGQWPEAAEAFRATERLAPRSAVGALNLGLTLERMGDPAGARRALLRAAELAPGDEEIERALAQLPAVVQAVAESATPAGRPARVGPCMTGDLRTFDLHQVLEFLQVQRKTGSLVLSARQGAGIVCLFQGEITSASAPGTQEILASLGQMSQWSEGGFSFHPTTPGEPPSVSYNVQQVLLELARQTDERRARG
jgi:Flp pilus assembly protein TadD